MKRRSFIAAAALGAAAATAGIPAPAIAQGRTEWKMLTSWPRGLPGVGTGAQRLADRIGAMTQGRLTIKLHAAGELVPGLQVFENVANGTAECGHDASYYHLAKTKAAAFFTCVPFGMTAQELNAWVKFGGGQALWDKAYEPFGIKAFLAGNTGCQMGGWYRREIRTVADFQGLKLRMPGLGGEVAKALGATTVLLPAGEIFQNLQSGAIDAAEWVGPANDLALGLHKAASHYYYPGFQEPGAGLQFTVNKAAFEALPDDIRLILEVACAAENDLMTAEYNAISPGALKELVTSQGVRLQRFPDEVLIAMGNASGALIREMLDGGDAVTREVAASFVKARSQFRLYTQVTDQAFTNARNLKYDYPS